MLFYIYYSCNCGENEEVISAKNYNEAEEYAYNCAKEEYRSYEGYHGIRSFSDILEEEFGVKIEDAEDFYDEADSIYNQEIEDTISYSVEDYDKEKHSWILESQNGKPYEI